MEQCKFEGELAALFRDHSRWSHIIDGNAKEPLGTRLKTVEDQLNRQETSMENLLESSENLKTAVHAMVKEYKLDKSNRKGQWSVYVQLITWGLVAVGLLYEIIFK